MVIAHDSINGIWTLDAITLPETPSTVHAMGPIGLTIRALSEHRNFTMGTI